MFFRTGFDNKMQKEKTVGNSTAKEIVKIDLADSESDSNGENPSQQCNASENMENQEDHKLAKMLKELLHDEDTKFMSNFYPELSNREKRKLNRKFALEGKKNNSLYDDHGFIRSSGKDLCDCLDVHCVGCHFPCPKCRSCKCGQECRVNRKWMYESVENETDKSFIYNNMQAL